MVPDLTCSISSALYFFLSITDFQRTPEHFAHVPGVPRTTKNSLSPTTQFRSQECTGASGITTMQPSAWEPGGCEGGQREGGGGGGGNCRGAEGTVLLRGQCRDTSAMASARGHRPFPFHPPPRALVLAGDLGNTKILTLESYRGLGTF